MYLLLVSFSFCCCYLVLLLHMPIIPVFIVQLKRTRGTCKNIKNYLLAIAGLNNTCFNYCLC